MWQTIGGRWLRLIRGWLLQCWLGKGITLSVGGGHGGTFGGIEVDTSPINKDLYSRDVIKANQATRDFVSAFIGAHEAIMQFPRLQTFGNQTA